MDFTHFDESGNAIMVDVSEKKETTRNAVATGSIFCNRVTFEAILDGRVKKGDVLGVARVAGIMATKQTSSLLPMCHPIQITSSKIDYEFDYKEYKIEVFCEVSCNGQTGVEMEALTGVTVTLLTIYDMCKALDKSMLLSEIHLLRKTGGKTDYQYEESIHSLLETEKESYDQIHIL